MSGVAVIRHLLAADAAVIAVVPVARIISGELPLSTVMPAIEVRLIDGQPRLTVAMNEPNRMHTDRVQVSYLFKGPSGTPSGAGYPGVKAMAPLVLAACPNQHGTIASITVLDIRPNSEGPDLSDAATGLFSGSRDFIVRWKS